MTDLLIAAAFALLVFAPAFIASAADSHMPAAA